MKLPFRSVAWLLPLLLTACAHNTTQSQLQVLAPPIEDAPPPKADSGPANLPAPSIATPSSATVPATQLQPAKPLPKHKKPVIKPQPAGAAPAPSQQPTQQAVIAAPTEESAIGHLSSGELPDKKKQAQDLIAEVERGLGGVTRKLSDPEEKTSMQIKEYLKQANTALGSGDVDGANTLAQKAKVLLGELSQ